VSVFRGDDHTVPLYETSVQRYEPIVYGPQISVPFGVPRFDVVSILSEFTPAIINALFALTRIDHVLLVRPQALYERQLVVSDVDPVSGTTRLIGVKQLEPAFFDVGPPETRVLHEGRTRLIRTYNVPYDAKLNE